jgi:hypothetical protein
MARTIWTHEEVDELVANHERVLAMWAYPEEICRELRRARRKFLESVRVRISAGER